MYSRTDYMTITLLWHSSKHDSKSQATLRGCYKSSHKVWLIIQGQAAKISWFQHPSWPLKLQIDKSLGLLPFSDAFPIDTSTTQLKWCFDKKRLTSKTPISGVIGCIFFREGAIIFFSWIVKCFSLWQSGFSESERMSGSVWCSKRLIRQRKSCL